PENTGTLPRLLLGDEHALRQWGARDHGMDTANFGDRAVLRRTLPKSSSVGARCLHRSDGERQGYRVGGLLRRTDLAAHRFGGALQGMGRTLIRGACRIGEVHRRITADWWPWAHAVHALSCRPGTGDACRKAGRPRPWARDRGRKNGPGHATAP